MASKGSPFPAVGSSANPRQPSSRQMKSAGAAVARTFAGMAKPKKMAIVVQEFGRGSEAVAVSKGIRGGEGVLSRPTDRYGALTADHDQPADADLDFLANLPAGGADLHLAADAAAAVGLAAVANPNA